MFDVFLVLYILFVATILMIWIYHLCVECYRCINRCIDRLRANNRQNVNPEIAYENIVHEQA